MIPRTTARMIASKTAITAIFWTFVGRVNADLIFLMHVISKLKVKYSEPSLNWFHSFALSIVIHGYIDVGDKWMLVSLS